MDISSQEAVEIPMPISSTYVGGHGHMIHHDPPLSSQNQIIPSSAPQLSSMNGNIQTTPQEDHMVPYKKVIIKYKECLKNHAAAMGGNATDGCGEFMPSGEEGSIEALKCLACNCHRNFHRKEIDGDDHDHDHHQPSFDYYQYHHHHKMGGRKVLVGHHHKMLGSEALGLGYPTATGTYISSRAPQPHQMIMSYNLGGSIPSESDEQEGVTRVPQMMKKRFRTKFTPEQKEKMFVFAEKSGWRIQKQEESVLQSFCQEIGVKRRVLKVWMHNNKHNLAKKNSTTTSL
ncbi:hypothetical protein GIB67_001703 [Kingdonia uniflora]|uniref:ZF-HD dimerization-type domain-containing protein n=1 Tax=Kingdonia uniflora TaxID=39325 RepID=A0A7J7LMX2_9MAGN|nr:hypothetical protein GIB67_001703 [Kingdonia uniflora]